MKAEDFAERKIGVDGWQVNLTSYKLGETFYCKADNVSPGAWLARTTGVSRAEAEERALTRAKELLSRTHRRAI